MRRTFVSPSDPVFTTDMNVKEKLEQLKLMEGVAWRCICAERYFELTTGYPGQFWPLVQNSLGEGVCILWSHLFGNRSDDLHYSKFFSDADMSSLSGAFNREAVKNRILSNPRMSSNEYEVFWREVKACRDQFVAHKDISKVVTFPRIEKCRMMMEELRIVLGEVVEKLLQIYPDDSELISLSEYYRDHSNVRLQKECLRQFEDGIVAAAHKIQAKYQQ